MANKKLPNIIIFNPDQWRGKDVGCLGNPIIQTPHTDALMEEGVAFENCFVQNTVCTPSRCSFFTGWYPHVRGHRLMHHMLSPEEPFLLKQLKDRGYHVWWGGKNDVVRHDEQSNVVNERFYPDAKVIFDKNEENVKHGDPMFGAHYQGKMSNERVITRDDANVQGAIDFINSHPPEPYCICLTLSWPHVPFEADEPYYSMYDRDKLPPIIPKPEEGMKTKLLDKIRERMGLEKLNGDDFKEILAVYYGMISRIDTLLGNLTDSVKEAGHWDDTAVFVFGDHGEYAGDYCMMEKTQNTFEDSLTKVPLIIKYPKQVNIIKRDKPVDALVELIDFYATVEELADLPRTHTHFGKSLIPISTGKTEHHRDEVFCEGGARLEEPHTHELLGEPNHVYWTRLSVQNEFPQYHGKAVMVRTKEWKYVKRLYERDELYHLKDDPDELFNVVDDPQYIDVRAQMIEKIADWFIDTGDVVPYRLDPRFKTQKVPDYIGMALRREI
jgi:arylsulfatase A-like enzyme